MSFYTGPRTERLTTRISKVDVERIKRIQKFLADEGINSQGKAISAALKIADEKLSKGGKL